MLAQNHAAGFEAWVEGLDDQKRLNEYQIEHHPATEDKSSYTECFLETIDEPFKIMVNKPVKHNRNTEFRSTTKVDGHVLESFVWLKGYLTLWWDEVLEQEGGKTYTSKLKFAPTLTTDDPNQVTIDKAALSTLGTIEIILEKGKFAPSRMGNAQTTKIQAGVAHEESKKFSYSVTTTDRKPYEPQENEPESSPTPPPPPRKRKRYSEVIEIDTDEEAVDIKGEEDVKPNLTAKRMKYLEEQIKLLSGQLKQKSKDKDADNGIVDLTKDDEE
uniref:Uncharacterized protein n=1 Tax=Kwoniella pini CBS 10737 TaxID=1296096 RepID=A0A1B9I5L6_9TREE|nr:uncharacterized protein I206_02881 [Kwoniella pini CBS 10737]OCF50824.1 hypothetical protein I206_02881 [Kwoniella pini CBS 10737]